MQETPGFGGSAPQTIALPSRGDALALYGLFAIIVGLGSACLAPSLLVWVAMALVFGVLPVVFVCGAAPSAPTVIQPLPIAGPPGATGPTLVAVAVNSAFPVYSAPVERIDCDLGAIDAAMRVDTTDSIARALARSAAVWCLTDSRTTDDARRNAGASTVVERVASGCRRGVQGPFVSNIDPWWIDAGWRQLVLFPEFMGVLQSGVLSRVAYSSITVSHRVSRFVEEGPVPPDATVVDTSWRYVCRDGTPDLRFADNRQLPVLGYGEVELSAGGHSITFQTSLADAARVVAELLVRLGARSLDAAAPPIAPPIAPESPFGPAIVLPPMSALEGLPPPPVLPALPGIAAPSPPSPMVSSSSAGITWRDLAIVLKRVALADRRFSRDELEAITQTVREWDPSGAPDAPSLRALLEELRADETAFDAAIARCAGGPIEQRRRVFESCQRIAGADGRVTPKETERLAAIARALQVEG